MFAIKRISSYAAVLLLFCANFLFTHQLHAQAPEGVNYQAVARDNAGDALTNQIISVRFSIIATSTSGTVLYEEEHSTISTNDFGLFNLRIGQGNRTGGSAPNFAGIDWSSGNRFLRVEVDAGSGFENLGTTQLLSVPYALYAKTSGNASSNLSGGNGITIRNDSIINDGDLSETNELITSFSIEPGNVLRITEASTNYDVDLTSLLPSSTDDQNLSFNSTGDSILIEGGDGIEIQFILDDIANNAADIVTNQTDITNLNSDLNTLKGNFSTDSSQTLQNQDSIAILATLISSAADNQNLSLANDSILIERGTGVDIEFLATDAKLSADSALLAAGISTNETDITNLNADLNTLESNFSTDSSQTLQNRDSIGILSNLITTDNDADSTNELIDSIRFVGRTLEIYQQGGVVTLSFDTLFDSRRLNLFNRTIANRDSIRILTSLIGNDNDTSASNEIQQLSLVADQLSIDDPSGTVTQTPIDLSIYNTEDNLGNHQLDSNLKLNNFYISNDGDNEGISINPSGEVSISSPTGTSLTIAKDAESSLMEFISFGTGNGAGTRFDLYNARGTRVSPSVVADGDRLFSITNRSRSTTGPVFNELIQIYADGAVGAAIVPTRTNFYTIGTDGNTAASLVLRSSGNVGIGEEDPDSLLEVNGGAKLGALNINGAYTFPVTDGIGEQFLQTDGGGNVSWSSTLPSTNCPTGMTNVQGNICIETNERAASDWYDAANTCASLGYKLPSWAEWYGAATNAVLTNEINNWEWVSDGTSNTARKVGNTNLKNTANDDPETGSANFRCIFYK
ncbi:MAG: hypothetical protein RJQ00_00290 [Vicingaceae bacterium]